MTTVTRLLPTTWHPDRLDAARFPATLGWALLWLVAPLTAGLAVAQSPPFTPAQAGAAQQKAADQAADQAIAWKPLFDGKTLKDWKVTQFGGEGDVAVENGAINMQMGSALTGITYLKKLPTCDYEIRVEAKRVSGIDFFSTVTFPVNDAHCSLVVGGWAGSLVGLSCLDYADASENETTTFQRFETDKWYQIRIQVRRHRIRAWIDDKQVVDVDIQGRKISTRVEVDLNRPFGIASWETQAAIRKIEIRELGPEKKPPAADPKQSPDSP